jgi:hypothetical protein
LAAQPITKPTEVAQTEKKAEQVKAGSVQRRGDVHTTRVNEDEIGKAKAEYRVKRPRRIDGLTAGKAKGPLMPSKNGAQVAYTASDLTYDIRTGLVAIIPPEDWEEDHEERPAPKREQRIEPPTKTEVASVSREHAKAMVRATKPDMANTIMLSIWSSTRRRLIRRRHQGWQQLMRAADRHGKLMAARLRNHRREFPCTSGAQGGAAPS